MSQVSKGPSTYRDRFSIWEFVVVLLVLGVGLGGYGYLRSLRGPTSNGVSVAHWVKRNKSKTPVDIEHPDFIAEVEAFGPGSIPVFIDSLNWATNSPQAFNWFGFGRRSPFSPLGGGRGSSRERLDRVYSALIVLAGKYPDEMNPYATNLLTGASRFLGIRLMGEVGDRHYSFLTNLVFTAHYRDANLAVLSLPEDASRSVPIILRYMELRGRSDWLHMRFAMNSLARFENDERVVPALLGQLQSTNMQIRHYACRAMKRMTNHHAEIRPEVVQAARDSLSAIKVWASPAAHLIDFDVSANEGVPVLMDYLNKWVPIEGREPYPTNVIHTLRFLSGYGSKAHAAVPVVEKGVLTHLRPLAAGFTSRSKVASTLTRIEAYLEKMTP